MVEFIIQVSCMLYGSYGSVLQCKFQPFVDFVKKRNIHITSILSTTEMQWWLLLSMRYALHSLSHMFIGPPRLEL